MKHEHLLACLILSITLAISACGSDDRESADYIGIESAKGIALRSAGLSSDQAEFIKRMISFITRFAFPPMATSTNTPLTPLPEL